MALSSYLATLRKAGFGKLFYFLTSIAKTMPADGWGLGLYEMQSFRAWIDAGAEWPRGREGELKVKPYSIERPEPIGR